MARCGPSHSPTGAATPTDRRTRSRPSGARSSTARGASSRTPASPADGEVVLVHDAVSPRAAFRRLASTRRPRPSSRSSTCPGSPISTPSCGTGYELSLDLYDRRSRVPVLDVAAAAGAADRLWVCSARVATLRDPASGDSGAPGALDPAAADHAVRWSATRRPRRSRARRREHALHRLDGGARRAVPPLRASARSRGTSRRCGTSAPCSRWELTRSTRTTSIAWSRPSPNGASDADPATGSPSGRVARCARRRGPRCSTP